MLFGVVDTKKKDSEALTPVGGLPAVPEADTVAGPAVVAQIITVALPPIVVALFALKVPRVDAKLTVVPFATGTPLTVQFTVTGTFGVHGEAAIGMYALVAGGVGAGAVIVNC